MTTIDLSPLYRNSVGFDRMGTLLDNALRSQKAAVGFPPYDIEASGDDRYAITLAVACCARRTMVACSSVITPLSVARLTRPS